MQRYANLSGDSGVAAYESGADRIGVRFRSGAVYLYSERSAGRRHVDTLKRLAQAGRGLSTYIARRHPPYESKR